MNRVVLLSRVVALLSGVFLVVCVHLLAYTVMMHRNGLALYVLVWICTAGLVVSEPACALFVEKAEYAQKHRWLIIGSWVYLVCGAVAAVINAALYPSWEKQGVVSVSAGETPWIHLVIVQAPVGLVFFRLMREKLIDLLEKRKMSHGPQGYEVSEAKVKVSVRRGSSVLYEDRLWSRRNVPLVLLLPVASAALAMFVPEIRSMALTVAVLGIPLALLSPYKIVVTAERIQVKDLVNLFGWSVNLKDVSRVSVLPARNRIKILYRYGITDHVRSVTCARIELLVETLKSVAPHIQIDTL